MNNSVPDIVNLSKEGVPIVILGLPWVGKTTLVEYLKDGKFHRPQPTIALDFERVSIGNLSCHVFDISGQDVYRDTLWRSYIKTSVGIIYIHDTSKAGDIEESAYWYWKIIDEWLEDNYMNKVILFLANKSDLKKSVSLEEVINKFDLNKMTNYPNITFKCFKTSIRKGTNINYALRWFSSKVEQAILDFTDKPDAIIIGTKEGRLLYSYDPYNITSQKREHTELFSGFLSATSSFSNEILGKEEVKVLIIKDCYFLLSEENNFLTAIAFRNEKNLPEARRLSHVISKEIKQIFSSSNSLEQSKEKLERFIDTIV